MNFFELINAILMQLDLPAIDNFSSAKLPIHNKIKAYINKINKQIISYNNCNFQKIYLKNTEKTDNSGGEFVAKDGILLIENNCFSGANSPSLQNFMPTYFAKDEFGSYKQNLENDADTSIIPEPFGSELIICGVCNEINQEPNNPKYAHWRQKYNNAFAQLNAQFRDINELPKFKIKRG